jgi:hypothetical protein
MTQTNVTVTATTMYLDYDDWSPRYDPASFYTMQLQGYIWITSHEQLNDIIQQQQCQEDKERDQSAQSISTSDNDRTLTSDINHKMPMNCRLPTYYYKIIVYCGHHQHVLYRSYIQFEWLYHQLRMTMPKEQLQSKVSRETTTIPHPLQGNLDNDKCNFMGYCWIVQQMQELLDFMKQQQFQHQPEYKDSTTTSNTEQFTSNMNHTGHYNSTLAETRCQKLSYFLTTVLEQHGRSTSAPAIISANQSALLQFLEL